MKHLAIFASGTGSNALKIIEHFKAHPSIRVALIVSNKKEAPVLDIARRNGIPTTVISRKKFKESEYVLEILNTYHIDFVVLAGFLLLVPSYLVDAYQNKIVNIHPALLPAYGGKGMYGMNVHQAVHQAGEAFSGITIHYVNEHYDEGNIIFQAKCAIERSDTPKDIAMKVRTLEHRHFAPVVESLLSD